MVATLTQRSDRTRPDAPAPTIEKVTIPSDQEQRPGVSAPDRTGTRTDGGILIGRPFGIPVLVSPSWFVVAALITYVFRPTVQEQVPTIGAAGSWLVAFTFAVLLYASVLVHELCHSVTALRLGFSVRRITLHLLGGVSEIEQAPDTPRRSFLISVAGPAVNVVIAALAYVALQFTTDGSVLDLLASALMGTNVLVAVFNMLPGLPLDGGHVLEAAVWKVTGRRTRGTVAAAWCGRVLAVLLVAVPVVLALARGSQPSVITVVWGLLLGSFIWVGAGAALTGARTRDRLPRVGAGLLARRAIPVERDLPVSEGVRRAQEAGALAMVVVDGAGRPTALVQEDAVRAMPVERRPWVTVGQVSRSIDEALVLQADLAGEALVTTLSRRVAPEYLVVDAAGRVVGVLAMADVERVLTADG